MADITYTHYISNIRKNPKKSHWRVRHFKKLVEDHISGLRLTWFRMRGTYTAYWCMRESVRLEKLLQEALQK